MQRIVCLALALTAGTVLLASCGGDSADRTSTATVGSTATVARTATQAATGTPQAISYLILEVDVTTPPPGASVDEALQAVEGIIQQRAEAMGAELSDIERQGTNRLALEVSGVTVEEARDTFGRTGLLEFREPERDESGKIVCQDAAGQTFTIPGDTAAYITVDANGDLTQCQNPSSLMRTGSVVWKPATGVGNDNVEKALTGRFLTANARVFFDRISGLPLVSLEFNSEGGRLFDQITARLVGFPMAIFVDDEIVSAPTIRQRMSDGNAVIEGLTADEARSLSIQLNSGALPVPLQVIAAGEGPLP